MSHHTYAGTNRARWPTFSVADPLVVGCGGKDHLCGKNHIAIQRFIISRWTPCFQGSTQKAAAWRIMAIVSGIYSKASTRRQGVGDPRFSQRAGAHGRLVIGNLRNQHPHSTG